MSTINYFSSKEKFMDEFENRLKTHFLTEVKSSTIRERYHVLGEMVKDYLSTDWINTNNAVNNSNQKKLYYFSMEFLIGRLITNNIMALGLREVIEEAFNEYGFDLNEVEDYEKDPGLGNGGLGRLAACFLDSLASLGLPGYGNCIRYRYGLFRQKIKNGYQEERPDNWLNDGYAWEIRREEEAVEIPFFGYVEWKNNTVVYHPDEYIKAVPYDVPIVGYKNGIVNSLRLWNAEPAKKYPNNKTAFEYEDEIRRICGFLYPDDANDDGKTLRLMQQYFFSSAGVQNILNKEYEKYGTVKNLANHAVFHINDTHPTLVIPELMRLLLDKYGLSWDEAWDITTNTCAFTNHSILAEVLEKWPIYLIQKLLPRIYQIIDEIHHRFESVLKKYYPNYLNKCSIIRDGMVNMAYIDIVASFSVNGVAELHTDILKNIEMKEFNDIFKDKFNNKTNGITFRRWVLYSNKELSHILNLCTPGWEKDYKKISGLIEYRKDKDVKEAIYRMKLSNKERLAKRIFDEQGLEIDVNSIFDVQVKRLHEYKRQLLNALNIIYIYERLKEDKEFRDSYYPHTFIFGAKAASGYYFAKKVIKLINTIAYKVNNDEETNNKLKVVFLENYNVSYAELIFPACDVSEQISTASKEASGTGNMKAMVNGAITIGTYDGANVEMAEEVGDENIIIFGLRAEEVEHINKNHLNRPYDIYYSNKDVKRVVDHLIDGFFDNVDPKEFKVIYDRLVYEDPYLVLSDFNSYVEAHHRINDLYKDRNKWLEMSIINIARSAKFSSDRTIEEYNKDIWHLKKINLQNEHKTNRAKSKKTNA